MSTKLRTSLLVLVFLIGLLFFFINPIQSFLIDRLGKSLNDTPVEDLVMNDTIQASYDFEAVETLTILDVLKAQANKSNLPVIGSIAIPAVDLQLPIIKGVGRDALAVGAGTMKAEQKMGEGNYSLAGHYFEEKDILFGPLYQLQENDEIFLSDAKDGYMYRVTMVEVIEATDVYIIDDLPGSKLLTLITCAEEGSKRLAVQAEFVEKISLEDLDKKSFK